MKSYYKLTIAVFLTFLSTGIFSQVAYSPKIDSIINLCTNPTLSLLNREISGDTSTIIGGNSYTLLSRHNASVHNPKAAQFILERFQSYGLQARYMDYRTNGTNVLATKLGTRYPNRQYIICAHYDDMPSGPLAPGADDNGSGTCAVIEAARLIAPFNFDYTIIFIAFDEEELGLIGSHAYADSAYNRGDSILGVINLDMITWDGNNDYLFSIYSNSNSVTFSNYVKDVFNIYQPVVVPSVIVQNMSGSDHYYFWQRGYKALCGIENTSDFNPYYHTVNDNFSHVVMPYFLANTRASIAALMTFGWDCFMTIAHTPVTTAEPLVPVEIISTINSARALAKGSNGPRVYYKVNGGSTNYLNYNYNNLDTFKFAIPGQNGGDTVKYYIAAQDSLGYIVVSLPSGARGVNPPGTIAPADFFTYVVNGTITPPDTITFCSADLPKPILDNQTTYDTIMVSTQGIVVDLNVRLTIYHTWDADISIMLIAPGYDSADISSRNGGSGDNYINTVFDDEASTPITSGTPPFTGSYRPEQPLSSFDSLPLTGSWVLKVRDDFAQDTGQLVSWCLLFTRYIETGGVSSNQQPLKFELAQNYPNPFNSSTRINFNISKHSEVKIILYDILGREVRSIADGKFAPGKYDLYLSVNDLASGVYFYSMYIDGRFFDTKKMVMIK
jgi:subtilisin-like proprotein convertase family protein